MHDNIGGGGFGIVFSDHISRNVCKKLPYFKVHCKKLGRMGEMNRLAIKRLKSECFYFAVFSYIIFQCCCDRTLTIYLNQEVFKLPQGNLAKT